MKIIFRASVKILFWCALVFITVLAFLPGNYAPDTGFSDKLDHAAAFAVLLLLACTAYPGKNTVISASLLLYGIFIEVVQYFIPGRSCSVYDLAADMTGIAAGLFLYACLAFMKKQHG